MWGINDRPCKQCYLWAHTGAYLHPPTQPITQAIDWVRIGLVRKLQRGKEGVCTEVHLMVRSRFGENCSCCCLRALPGPAWVLLNYVLHTILSTSVLQRSLLL